MPYARILDCRHRLNFELLPKSPSGDRRTLGEDREFRPDDVRINRSLPYPSPIPTITAGDYVLPTDQFRIIADAVGYQLRVFDKIRF
jgi:hypothetical protein